jgi:hypothetical protein
VYKNLAITTLGDIDEEMLHYMSPAGWEHINLLGEYLFNSEKWSQKIF